MNSTAKRASAALGSTAILAAGAYGVVIKGGDAPAQAASSGSTARTTPAGAHLHRIGGPGLGGLASRLGVSQAQLRKALDAIRPVAARKDGPGDALVAPLADALGISQDKLRAAFAQIQKSHDADRAAEQARVTAAVAKTLGVDEAKVKAALADAGPPMGRHFRFRGGPKPPKAGARPRHDDPGDRLDSAAKTLGVSAPKLRSALQGARQDDPGRPGRGTDPLAADLAKALGIDAAKVDKALQSLQKTERTQGDARRNAFAAKLAKELGIPEAKVRAALPDHSKGLRGPGPDGHRGRGGRGGPGGPGDFDGPRLDGPPPAP